jgi:hypothetical protein
MIPSLSVCYLRIIRKLKRQKRVSNRKLKKLGVIATHSKAKLPLERGYSLSVNELNLLQSSWKQYIRTILKGCKNPMQFQARYVVWSFEAIIMF